MLGAGTNPQRHVRATFALPQPPQANAAAREVSVSCDGQPATVYDLALAATEYVVDVPRNAKVHVELADLDAAGNRGVSAAVDFLAVSAPQLPAPGPFSLPVMTEVPQPAHTTISSQVPGSPSQFVKAPGTAP